MLDHRFVCVVQGKVFVVASIRLPACVHCQVLGIYVASVRELACGVGVGGYFAVQSDKPCFDLAELCIQPLL